MATWELLLNNQTGGLIQDISPVAVDKKGSYRLNRPAVWTVKCKANACAARKGHRLKIRRNGACVFNGIVMRVDREGDANTAWATITACDPMIWWPKRPVRDETGDFSRPVFTAVVEAALGTNPVGSSIPTFRPISGAELLRRAIVNSEYWEESSLWLDTDTGSYSMDAGIGGDAADLGIDDLTDWPITIADLSTMMVNSGSVDIVISPVDGGYSPEILGVLSVVSQTGTDRSGSVVLEYGHGDFNVSNIRHTEDLESLCNRLWYYLGPPQGVQRYKGNITGTIGAPDGSELASLISASRAFYGVAMDVRIYDSGNENDAREAFLNLWRGEALLRVNGQELLAVTIKPGGPMPLVNFGLGDILGVSSAASVLGVDVSGAVRVYGFDIEIDREGVERPGELIVSADGG